MHTHRLSVLLFFVLAAIGLTACGAAPIVAPAPTVDTDAIVGQVLAELTAVAPTAQPTVMPVINTSPGLAADQSIQRALIDLYQQTNLSVVFIILPNVGSGSGFVYSDAGHIVTNYHVASGGRDYEIVFANGERRSAALVGSDADSDLAVLQVDALPAGVKPLPLADGDNLAVGQFVAAIGNPFGEQGSMSLGIVSALGRSLESQRNLGNQGGSTYSLPEVIQTDAPINPGNSGGPLLNLQGEVVGINAAILSDTGANSGVGFAIPVQAVQQIVPSLIARGRYVYPYMGAAFDSEVSLADQTRYGLSQTQGAYVVGVTAGSPAAQAGLISADSTTTRGGDLIIAIDGQPVNNFADMNSYLVFHTAPGQTVELTVLRGEKSLTLPLTLGERP